MTAELTSSTVSIEPYLRRPFVQSDPSYASLSLLARLRESLWASAKLLAACRVAEASAEASAAPLFFFDRDLQTEWKSLHRESPEFPEPHLTRLERSLPAESLAWRQLPDLLDDARTLLAASISVRRSARAMPGFLDAVRIVGNDLLAAKEVAELLGVLDDQVILAIHPAERVGVRLHVRGLADFRQLQVFLMDAMIGDPNRGLIAGKKPEPRWIEVYRDGDPKPEAPPVTPRFQLFHPKALRSDGSLPNGFDGVDDWFWNESDPNELPSERGERVVLVSDRMFPESWTAKRRHPRVNAQVQRMELLDSASVESWLAAHCPNMPKRKSLSRSA